MTVSLAIACGEVGWERDLLAQAQEREDVAVAKRYVDMVGIERDERAGALPHVVVMSPALRGFLEKPVRSLAMHAYVVVLVDSIRPPWLAASGLDCRDIVGLDVDALLAELATIVEPRAQIPREVPAMGAVTAFVGVGGGVGTTTLALLHARSHPDAVLIDGDATQPALGFMLGRSSTDCGLGEAMGREHTAGDLRALAGEDRVLTLSRATGATIGGAEMQRMLDVAAEQFPEVVVDAGSQSPLRDAILERCDRLVVVAAATPLGIVRLCSDGARNQHPLGGVAVIVNRFRDSALGSGTAAGALRALVEAEVGLRPTLVADDTAAFDQAWLDGDWRRLQSLLPCLEFTQE